MRVKKYMRIAVLSDSHDNIPNIILALKYIQKAGVNNLIHCGDVCLADTLKTIAKNFSGNIFLACGNNDDYGELSNASRAHKQVAVFENIGEANIFGKKIAFCHYPDMAETLAKSKKYDAIFYGHDHRPWEKKIYSVHLLNPGTLAGIFSRPTFALYDLKSFRGELMLIESLEDSATF